MSLGIPQERIAKRLGLNQASIHNHLLKMATLPNLINTDFSPFNYDHSTTICVDSVPAYKPPQRFCLTWANTPSKLTRHFPIKIILFLNPLSTNWGNDKWTSNSLHYKLQGIKAKSLMIGRRKAARLQRSLPVGYLTVFTAKRLPRWIGLPRGNSTGAQLNKSCRE